MRAEQLMEIVNDLPKDAWPPGLDYVERGEAMGPFGQGKPEFAIALVVEGLSGGTFRHPNVIPAVHAALMFEASILRWLLSAGYHDFEFSVEVDSHRLTLEFGGQTAKADLVAGQPGAAHLRVLVDACIQVSKGGI